MNWDCFWVWFKKNSWRPVYLFVGFGGLWLWFMASSPNVYSGVLNKFDSFVYMFGWAALAIVSTVWFILPAFSVKKKKKVKE